MVRLCCLQRIQPADIGRALAAAMEYRTRLQTVWLVADTRHDCIKVCRPDRGGLVYDTAAAEVWELAVYGAEYAEPYMQLVFTPGVLPKLEEKAWRQLKQGLSVRPAPYCPGQSMGNRAGR